MNHTADNCKLKEATYEMRDGMMRHCNWFHYLICTVYYSNHNQGRTMACVCMVTLIIKNTSLATCTVLVCCPPNVCYVVKQILMRPIGITLCTTSPLLAGTTLICCVHGLCVSCRLVINHRFLDITVLY